MESALTKACTLKFENFEGPFDLLFHLFEKSQIDIYDIPINEITDQYMEYLFDMQELDMEVASEFLLVAATLLHIKSKMLLPDKKEKKEDEIDPRQELVLKLIQYKKYKEFSSVLREREKEWEKVCYKLPEVIEIEWEEQLLELSPEELKNVYSAILERNRKKMNNTTQKMAQIIQHEKVSLKSKMKEVIGVLYRKAFFKFSELFAIKNRSKTEVVTGFLAILELSKLKKVKLEQKKQFSDIFVYKLDKAFDNIESEKIAAEK